MDAVKEDVEMGGYDLDTSLLEQSNTDTQTSVYENCDTAGFWDNVDETYIPSSPKSNFSPPPPVFTTPPLPYLNFIPREIEIMIIKLIPMRFYPTLRQVCWRWHDITLHQQVKYTRCRCIDPNTDEEEEEEGEESRRIIPPNLFRFHIHRAFYEIPKLWSSSLNKKYYCKPDKKAIAMLAPYKDDPLTIPPLPQVMHSNVQINFYLSEEERAQFANLPNKRDRKLNLFHPRNDEIGWGKYLILPPKEGESFPVITVGDMINALCRHVIWNEDEHFEITSYDLVFSPDHSGVERNLWKDHWTEFWECFSYKIRMEMEEVDEGERDDWDMFEEMEVEVVQKGWNWKRRGAYHLRYMERLLKEAEEKRAEEELSAKTEGMHMEMDG